MWRERHVPKVCGSSEDSVTYSYAQQRTIIKVTEHILEARSERRSRKRTLVLAGILSRNGPGGFGVGQRVLDSTPRGAQPLHPDVDGSPLLLKGGLLPVRHCFGQVHLAAIPESQSRVHRLHASRGVNA